MPRLSLRELLLLVTLAALGIVSLKYASEAWQIGIRMLALLVFIGTFVTAVIDRGRRQAFGMGMALAMAMYGALIVTGKASNNADSVVGYGGLPTTRLLVALYNSIATTHWFDPRTGKEIVDLDRYRQQKVMPPIADSLPLLRDFMPIGHSWWALLLGYFGGCVGRFVYWRRLRDET